MITSYLDQVAEFHRVMKYRTPEPTQPALSDPATNALRPRLIAEELHELRAAIDANDRLEQLDALCDIQYVHSGAVLAWGLRAPFAADTITTRLRPIPYITDHLAMMFGMNAMMEVASENNSTHSVVMCLRDLQSRLSQLVWHFGFSECFSEAFSVVHQNNLVKIWSDEQRMIHLNGNGLDPELSFEKTVGGYIARRADGKIEKPAGFVKVSLERFV